VLLTMGGKDHTVPEALAHRNAAVGDQLWIEPSHIHRRISRLPLVANIGARLHRHLLELRDAISISFRRQRQPGQ
jgi:hypothetical protein